MRGKTLLRQIICMLLVLMMVLPCAAEETAGADKAESALKRYTDGKTVSSIFRAAERALADGLDPAQVSDEMYSLAEEQKLLPYLQYALENSAAYETEAYEKISAVAGSAERKLSLGDSPFRSYWEKIGFDPWGHFSGSAAFTEMIEDHGARYNLEAGFWKESEFQTVYGTSFSKFKPSRPRAGYVCVVVADGTQREPETDWDAEGDKASFLNRLQGNVKDLIRIIREEDSGMTPVFTGNPDIASSFWVLSERYPFRGWYGKNNRKEVRGFNSEASLTVIDAQTHQVTAKITQSNKLPNTIDWWHDGISYPDYPYLIDNKGFETFAAKVRKAIEKQYAAQETARRMTRVTAASVLNGILQKQADESKDAWVKAICESGVSGVTLEEEQVTFCLRSYNPQTKDLGTYAKAEDGNAWLQAALANASAYDLELTLPVEDGTLTKQAKTSLAAALKKAAASALAGFGGKDMSAALKDRFFPAPVEGKITDGTELASPSESFVTWYNARALAEAGVSLEEAAIACCAQKSQTLNAKAGPHRAELVCIGAEPTALIKDSAKAVLDEMAFAPAETRRPADQAEAALRETLLKNAVNARTKSTAKYTLIFDFDDLAEGKDPEEYIAQMAGFSIEDAAEGISSTAKKFPEEAAVAMPKAGKLKQGVPDPKTKVTFDLYEGAGPTYVQIRSEHGSVLVSAFVYPGKKVTVLAPKGFCRLAFCTGSWWFGEKGLFGDAGEYYISETTQILDSEYTHTYSLNPNDEDDILFTPASPKNFR